MAIASGYSFSGVTIPENDHELYTVSYAQFVVPLVKAAQEQQVMIDDLKKSNADLLVRLEALERIKSHDAKRRTSDRSSIRLSL